MTSILKGSVESSEDNAFARSMDCTNTRHGGENVPDVINCRRANSFPFSVPAYTSSCVTVSVAESLDMLTFENGGSYLSPMMTRRGSVMTERASCSTVAGIVALKRALWTFFAVQAARISSVCSRRPSSNNLSASSRTRYFTLL